MPGIARPLDVAAYTLLAVAAGLLWWWCLNDPLSLPAFAPWDFRPLQFLAIWLAAWWYLRGVLAAAPEARPAAWRSACFLAGLLVTYTVVQTRFEYLAEHMFFLNRLQHIVMHHLGPLLIVLGWPGDTLKRGMPQPITRLCEAPWLVRTVHWIQQPVLAAVLFVGLIALWLIPPLHFRAMIDPDLYAFMNWTMVVDGILFWSLILDPRPSPPARVSFVRRAILIVAVMFPQIAIGALITFWKSDLYDFYHWCGRIWPDVGAARDQMFGGLIIWIPGAMMSVIALLLVLNFLRQSEKQNPKEKEVVLVHGIDPRQWTGL